MLTLYDYLSANPYLQCCAFATTKGGWVFQAVHTRCASVAGHLELRC